MHPGRSSALGEGWLWKRTPWSLLWRSRKGVVEVFWLGWVLTHSYVSHMFSRGCVVWFCCIEGLVTVFGDGNGAGSGCVVAVIWPFYPFWYIVVHPVTCIWRVYQMPAVRTPHNKCPSDQKNGSAATTTLCCGWVLPVWSVLHMMWVWLHRGSGGWLVDCRRGGEFLCLQGYLVAQGVSTPHHLL